MIVCWKENVTFSIFVHLNTVHGIWDDCLCDLQLWRPWYNFWSNPMVEIWKCSKYSHLPFTFITQACGQPNLYCQSIALRWKHSHMAFDCKLSVPLNLFLKKHEGLEVKLIKIRTWNHKVNHRHFETNLKSHKMHKNPTYVISWLWQGQV